MGARRNNGQKTSPKTIEAKIKAAKALELRMEGKTFQEIADEIGYNSYQAAYDAVLRAIKSVYIEPAEELIRIETERLDKLWGIQYLNAQAGDVQAMAACMKIMERRAKLLGLDAPVKQDVRSEVTTKSGVLMVPAPVDMEGWAKAAEKQQAELNAEE